MIVEVKNLVVGYGDRTLIRNLSFSIATPAFVAVIGHNGAGKTTLFKSFQQQVPYKGQILINGDNLQTLPNPTRKGILSYLPQKNTVAFPIKVHDLVVMGLFRKKRFFEDYNNTDYEQAAAVIEHLQLTHLLEQDFTTLSGGEQQLVWLAQLILQDAAITLLDEPTQQLDVYYKNQVFALLQNWVAQKGKTVFCITHDLQNLTALDGFLLNLSAPDLMLEKITPEAVNKHQTFLEAERGAIYR